MRHRVPLRCGPQRVPKGGVTGECIRRRCRRRASKQLTATAVRVTVPELRPEPGTPVPLWAALVLLLLSWCGSATAQRSAEISYQAPEGCPSREAFLEEVDRRLIEPELSATLNSVHAEITEQGASFRGQLQLADRQGRTTTRSLSGDSCEEVARALALISALALQAQLEEQQSAEATPERTALGEPEPPAPLGTLVAPARFAVGLQLGTASAYSPDFNGQLRGFGEFEPTSLFAVRLSLGYGTSLQAETSVGQAHFEWLGARADACTRSTGSGTLRVGLCAGFEFGYLRGSGQPVGVGGARRSAGVPWLAPGLTAELQVPLSARWRMELNAGAQLPLYREKFIFRRADGSDERIHEIPGAGWLGSLGVAYLLP